MTGLTLREMLLNGWPVISVLLILSIFSVTIIYDRMVVLRRASMNAKGFVAQILKMLEEQGAEKTLAYCEGIAKPLAIVIAAVLRQPGKREAKVRALQHTLQAEMGGLNAHVSFLGTIASTAPFIGLFGTVVGIIKAFRDIAVNVGGGPEVVSAGIAEALVTTAFGLLVAIPAVFGFNHCVNRVEILSGEVEWGAMEVVEKVTAGEG